MSHVFEVDCIRVFALTRLPALHARVPTILPETQLSVALTHHHLGIERTLALVGGVHALSVDVQVERVLFVLVGCQRLPLLSWEHLVELYFLSVEPLGLCLLLVCLLVRVVTYSGFVDLELHHCLRQTLERVLVSLSEPSCLSRAEVQRVPVSLGCKHVVHWRYDLGYLNTFL